MLGGLPVSSCTVVIPVLLQKFNTALHVLWLMLLHPVSFESDHLRILCSFIEMIIIVVLQQMTSPLSRTKRSSKEA